MHSESYNGLFHGLLIPLSVLAVQAWYVIWGVQVAIMSFIYLFLDRLPYIKMQSADPGLMVNPIIKTGSPAMGTDDTRGYEIEVKTVYGNGNLTAESNQQY